MNNGYGVISLVVNGGSGDSPCFKAALRMSRSKIIVIGDSTIVRELVSAAGIEAMVEFMPAGTKPLDGSIIFDATKFQEVTRNDEPTLAGSQKLWR